MLFELFKNAMRAVIEHHGTGADEFPALEVLLVMGTEDLVIKVILAFFVQNSTELYLVLLLLLSLLVIFVGLSSSFFILLLLFHMET